MRHFVKKVAAMATAVMMMSTMVTSVSAVSGTVTNKYNELYYAGSETTTNYYVTNSKGTNKTSKKRYLYVSSIIMKKASSTTYSVLTSNASEGVAKANTSRYCYANIGAPNVARSYHRSIIRKSTSPTDTTLNMISRYIYY